MNQGQPSLFFVVAPLFLLIPADIFYVLTLRRALLRCSPENRAMDPRHLWLLFIPGFIFVWNFVVVHAMARSLASEFARREASEVPDTGRRLGMAMSVLLIAGFLPVVGRLSAVGAMVLWIVYWVRIAALSRRLARMNGQMTPDG